MTRRSDDRRAAILQAMRGSPGGVSGERLANELGVSRVAVRKHIEALRELGYSIDARQGQGYRLTAAPDAPTPLEVCPLLRTTFVVRLEGGRVTGSTNDDARALALEGAAEGTAVLAASQTSGRGRLGREWVSPEGGVYASIVLRPSVQTPEAVVLPLVVGLGVARGLDRLGVSALLKWPNDVLSEDGRKIAGVLLEGLSEAWRIDWVVAGVGVNVRSAPDPSSGASVDELTGSRVPLAEAAAAVLDGIGEQLPPLAGRGLRALRGGVLRALLPRRQRGPRVRRLRAAGRGGRRDGYRRARPAAGRDGRGDRAGRGG